MNFKYPTQAAKNKGDDEGAASVVGVSYCGML